MKTKAKTPAAQKPEISKKPAKAKKAAAGKSK